MAGEICPCAPTGQCRFPARNAPDPDRLPRSHVAKAPDPAGGWKGGRFGPGTKVVLTGAAHSERDMEKFWTHGTVRHGQESKKNVKTLGVTEAALSGGGRV